MYRNRTLYRLKPHTTTTSRGQHSWLNPVALSPPRDTTNAHLQPTDCTTTCASVLTLSKTHAFLCFQSSHDTSTSRELNPFHSSLGSDPTDRHHQELSLLSGSGGRTTWFSHCSTKDQTSLAKTQEESTWLIVSGAWLQKGQADWWGNPRLANLSEVQHLLMMVSQIKSLQFAGAQVFQIRFQGKIWWCQWTLPHKCVVILVQWVSDWHN